MAIAGVWAFFTLTTDAFPDLTPKQVIVMTEAPGLSQLEVEQQVSYPMETAMLGLPRTTEVRSISKVGLSVVTVTYEDDGQFLSSRRNGAESGAADDGLGDEGAADEHDEGDARLS